MCAQSKPTAAARPGRRREGRSSDGIRMVEEESVYRSVDGGETQGGEGGRYSWGMSGIQERVGWSGHGRWINQSITTQHRLAAPERSEARRDDEDRLAPLRRKGEGISQSGRDRGDSACWTETGSVWRSRTGRTEQAAGQPPRWTPHASMGLEMMSPGGGLGPDSSAK